MEHGPEIEPLRGLLNSLAHPSIPVAEGRDDGSPYAVDEFTAVIGLDPNPLRLNHNDGVLLELLHLLEVQPEVVKVLSQGCLLVLAYLSRPKNGIKVQYLQRARHFCRPDWRGKMGQTMARTQASSTPRLPRTNPFEHRRGLTWKVDLQAMRSNIREARRRLPGHPTFFGVLKADAYGFGLEQVAKAIRDEVSAFSVASPEAAARLLDLFPDLVVLIYPCPLEEVPDDPRIIATAWDEYSLERLLHFNNVKVAIKIDIGFGRLGFAPEQLRDALLTIRRAGKDCEGVYTHFSNPSGDKERTQQEFARFCGVLDSARRSAGDFGFSMAANSAAALLYPEMSLDAVNCGHLIYGFVLEPSQRNKYGLRRVTSQLSAPIIQIREFAEDERLGYGEGRILERNTKVAVAAAGYSDGYPTFGQMDGFAIIEGKRAPLLSSPTLEYSLFDVSDINCSIGGSAIFVGNEGGSRIEWQDAASWSSQTELSLAVSLKPTTIIPGNESTHG